MPGRVGSSRGLKKHRFLLESFRKIVISRVGANRERPEIEQSLIEITSCKTKEEVKKYLEKYDNEFYQAEAQNIKSYLFTRWETIHYTNQASPVLVDVAQALRNKEKIWLDDLTTSYPIAIMEADKNNTKTRRVELSKGKTGTILSITPHNEYGHICTRDLDLLYGMIAILHHRNRENKTTKRQFGVIWK